MKKITGKRFKPECIVSFSTENGELTARSKPSKQGEYIDGDVLNVVVDNDLNADSGTFQITLTRRNNWHKKLASKDLVKIMMRRRGESKKQATLFIGLIDDVRKNTTMQDQGVQRHVIVTGRSLMKAFIDFEVGVVPEAGEFNTTSLGWLAGRITFAGNDSAEIIKQIMEKLVFKYMNYEFENGKNFQDVVTLDLSSRKGEQLIDETSFVNYQGSILAFMKEVIDEPFNQLFMEVFDGEATLVERATPFNKDEWNNLLVESVSDDEIVSDNTGRSDIETYALYSVGVKNLFGGFDVNKSLGILPYWYEPYFKKSGLRRLHRFTAYVGYGEGTDTSATASKIRDYQKDLFNWNINNRNFYNGQIVVRGDSKYKIGSRILVESTEDNDTYEYFLEGVSHEFVNFDHWITTLQVTRGLPNAGLDRFSAPWGEYEEYEAGSLGTPTVDPSDYVGSPSGGFGSLPSGGYVGGTAQLVVNEALSWLSRPNEYVFGGGRSHRDILRGRFDCSSWVRYVYAQAGIDIGPLTGTTTDTLAKQGRPVSSLMSLKVGDLVFFNTYKYNGHVVIYLGDGEAIGTQGSTGVAKINVSNWVSDYGLGSMRRIL